MRDSIDPAAKGEHEDGAYDALMDAACYDEDNDGDIDAAGTLERLAEEGWRLARVPRCIYVTLAAGPGGQVERCVFRDGHDGEHRTALTPRAKEGDDVHR